MQAKTIIQLNEKDLLDLICKENKLERSKASICINYVEDDRNQGGSWTIQVQAPQKEENLHGQNSAYLNNSNSRALSNTPDNLKTNDFNPQR